MNGVLRSILDHTMSSSVVDFFRVTLLHIVSKDHQTLDFLCFLVHLQYSLSFYVQQTEKEKK